MADFKVKKGESLIVTLKKEPSSGSKTGARRRSGSIGKRPRSKYPARRRTGSAGALKFYDLGFYLSGSSYVEETFSVDIGDALSTRSITQADADGFNARLLRSSSLESLYKRIDYDLGSIYQITVASLGGSVSTLPSDPAWTENGLEVSDAILYGDFFGFTQETTTSPRFSPITLTGSIANRITLEPSYLASPVSYSPRSGDVYFLAPAFVKVSVSGDFNTSPTEYDSYRLGGIIRSFPRANFLDPSSSFYGDVFGSYFWDPNFPSHGATEYLRAWQSARIASNFADMTAFSQTVGSSTSPWAPFTPSDFPVSSFPIPPFGYPSINGTSTNLGLNADDQSVGIHILLAIIKRNSQLFYVWSGSF